MCMGSSAPPPPAPPPPPPVQIQPTELSPQVKDARRGVAERQRAAGVRRDTLTTSKQGLVDSNENSAKTLLGT